MNLIELRQKIVEQNGRYDLVNPQTWADNGIDWFINEAQKALDNKQTTPKSFGRYQVDLASGDYMKELKFVRSVQEVWMMNADGRFILERKPWGWIREEYADSFSNLTTGQPLYWADGVIGLSPEQEGSVTSSNYTDTFTYDGGDIMFSDEGSHYNYNGIIWMPPVDGVYTVEILAQFFSETLSADSDQNFWTIVYPAVLIKATNLLMEETYRNREGARDWAEALARDLQGIDHNLVDAEIAGINRMEE